MKCKINNHETQAHPPLIQQKELADPSLHYLRICDSYMETQNQHTNMKYK